MVLIHDIVEIDAGDTFFYSSTENHDNRKEELTAAKRIFGILPKERAEEFMTIWEEFEHAETDAAKFAKSMDRFATLLQDAVNDGESWAEFDIPYKNVYDMNKTSKNGSTTTWNYSETLIDESVEKGDLKKE